MDAIQEINAATGKDQFGDYSQSSGFRGTRRPTLQHGYAPGEAKMMANAFLAEPELPQVKEFAQNMIGLADGYAQSGDQTSHDTALQIAVDLGRRLDDPSGSESMLHQLVGLAVETAALSSLDPSAPYDTAGQTVQNRLDQITQQKSQVLQTLTAQADPLWQTLSDQDWARFLQPVGGFGRGETGAALAGGQ